MAMASASSSGLLASMGALQPWVLGHRGMGKQGVGSGASFPENSLRSFEAALDAGIPVVECDVRPTVDGGMVVLHDETLARTARGKAPAAPVRRLRLEEVREVDVGDGPPPLLTEVLELILRRGRGLFIELKEAGCADQVVRLLQTRDGASRAVNLISFHPELLQELRAAGLPEGTDMGMLFRDLPTDWLEQATSLGLTNVGVRHGAVDETHVMASRNAGIHVWVWNPVSQEEIRRAVQNGVAGMGSDDPQNSQNCIRVEKESHGG